MMDNPTVFTLLMASKPVTPTFIIPDRGQDNLIIWSPNGYACIGVNCGETIYMKNGENVVKVADKASFWLCLEVGLRASPVRRKQAQPAYFLKQILTSPTENKKYAALDADVDDTLLTSISTTLKLIFVIHTCRPHIDDKVRISGIRMVGAGEAFIHLAEMGRRYYVMDSAMENWPDCPIPVKPEFEKQNPPQPNPVFFDVENTPVMRQPPVNIPMQIPTGIPPPLSSPEEYLNQFNLPYVIDALQQSNTEKLNTLLFEKDPNIRATRLRLVKFGDDMKTLVYP